ncbi:MAG: hypothetical protein NZX77_00695 [Polyangiaceae bacterium]|nr:hypothetical protein [Polyangiaceae bacterium]
MEAFSVGPPLDIPWKPRRNVQVFGEVFARYAHEKWNEQPARSFDIPRARFGADAVLAKIFAARVLIETVRSAAPGSLYGIDGDSIVLRAREIYGEARSPRDWPVGMRLRLGLVPTLAITPLEQMWGRRVVAPTAQEASTLLSPADLGAALLVALPHQLGEVAFGVVNGEGFIQHEQNEGKNLQARLWLTPLDSLLPSSLSVKLLAYAEDGSLGPTQARADRYVGGLSVEHTHGAIGVDGTFADGAYGNSTQRARTATAWLRVGPFAGIEAVGRFDQIDPNRRANGGDDRFTAWQGGIGYHGELDRGHPEETFELFLTYRHSNGGPQARAADPRQPQRGPRIDLKVSF